jgi:hypothetical protein
MGVNLLRSETGFDVHIDSRLHDRLFLSHLTRSVAEGSIYIGQKEIEILWQSIEEVWRIPILFFKVSVLTPARNISYDSSDMIRSNEGLCETHQDKPDYGCHG